MARLLRPFGILFGLLGLLAFLAATDSHLSAAWALPLRLHADTTARSITTPQYTIRDLGAISTTTGYYNTSAGFGINNQDANGNFSVVGTSYDAGGHTHTFRWDYSGGTGNLQDLGTLLGSYNYSYPADDLLDSVNYGPLGYYFANTLNASGDVIGYSYATDASNDNLRHAFRYDDTNHMQDLGTLDNTYGTNGINDYSLAHGINANGLVVGESTALVTANGTTYHPIHAFGWTPNTTGSGGVMSDLGTLVTDPTSSEYLYASSYALGINNHNEVVGYSANDAGAPNAFLYTGSTMYDLGALSTREPYSYAYGINDAGQVIGDSYSYASASYDVTHAFFWQPGSTAGSGSMLDLGALDVTDGYSFDLSHAYEVNASGQVIGTSYIPGVGNNSTSTSNHGFLWTPTANPVTGGTMRDLGALPTATTSSGNTATIPLAINASGVVVGASGYGYYFSSSSSYNKAFVYTGGLMYDLNHLIPTTDQSNWKLSAATGINAQGDITGIGILNGYQHAFLLIPATASTTAPTPVITTLTPSRQIAGSPGFNMELSGSGYALGAVVHWTDSSSNVTTLTPTIASDSMLRVAIPASLIQTPGTASITVVNTDGTTSAAATFTITTPVPVPTITSITPSSASAPILSDLKLVIAGTHFVSNSTVSISNNFYFYSTTTTYVNSTELDVVLHPYNYYYDGTVHADAYNVKVTNPATSPTVGNTSTDGGSATGTFTLTNPTPTLTSLSPTSITQNAPDTKVTLTGTNFDGDSHVLVELPGQTTFSDFYTSGDQTNWSNATPNQLVVTLPSTDLTTPGTVSMEVQNQPRYAATSAYTTSGTQTLTITSANNPAPTVDHIYPVGARQNYPYGFTLYAYNTDASYVTGATLQLGSKTLSNATVSSDHKSIYATLPNTDFNTLAPGTTVPVTVTNPTPGGGTSTSTVNFTVTNPTPTVTSISPTSTTVGNTNDVTVTITGTNFVSNSTVEYYGNTSMALTVDPTTRSSTSLTVTIPHSEFTRAGNASIDVTNPALLSNDSNVYGDGGTAGQSFSVTQPAPTLTAISPTSGVKNTAVTLTLTGTGFTSGSYATFNGGNYGLTNISSDGTSATASISNVYDSGTTSGVGPVNVTVTVPGPITGGGSATTGPQTFDVLPTSFPKPTGISLSPSTVQAGHDGFVMTVSGTGIYPGATVSWNGTALRTSAYGSASGDGTISYVEVQVPASLVATQGTASVTVTNASPNLGTSAPATFTIAQGPQITSLSPPSALAGSSGLTLTINGTTFDLGATVLYNGSSKTTTYINSTELTIPLTAADLANAGTATVQVINPAPGAGQSNIADFSVINGNPAPTITSLSPSTVVAGSGNLTLTINGSNFLSTSAVTVSGQSVSIDSQTGTVLTVTVPGGLVGTAGQDTVTVTNPALVSTDGGSASAILTVTAANTPPTVSITAPANGATFSAPAAITLTATASATTSGASITGVEFYQGNTDLGAGTLSGGVYTLTLSGVGAGNYSYTAKATDSNGLTATSSAVSITVNVAHTAPTVSITAPTNGATFTAPANITVTANTAATTSGANISKVEFFQGMTKIGEADSAPYSITWSSVPAGNYSLTAKATDSNGLTATSTAVSITVNKAAPTVAVTSSLSPSTLGQSVTLTATLTGGDAPSGTVQFQDDGSNFGSPIVLSGGTASLTTSALAATTHSITAIYSGDANNEGVTSTAFSQVVNNPAPTYTDVTGNVQVTRSAIAGDGQGLAHQYLTVTNISGQTISGPIQVVLNGIPSYITISDASGTFSGAPYITATSGTLAPGTSIKVRVSISDPTNKRFFYSVKVYSGTF